MYYKIISRSILDGRLLVGVLWPDFNAQVLAIFETEQGDYIPVSLDRVSSAFWIGLQSVANYTLPKPLRARLLPVFLRQ